ncbi:flagellar hook assembly protein FlgD [Gracilimonas mengyeensis]|uniref:Basal-body rod modification protein FlgD n=1 Tax=Gracilimonas mengyeensis TaxID=1302730 RepID=A0A521EDR3_9BACT|nr:FlgD immunoglobulin-like domain containing protein [Gracilimonas mengyeensis]SMO81591.1 flagellar basal-body rod modification protein FlgD [Gracilimonas mengyeensis]
MDISQINSLTTSAYQQQNQKGKTEMGQNQFLQLLVAQMRNQDPINPKDGAEFASQLAQFNSVEQLIDVNSGLQTLQQSQDMMSASLSNSMAASLTGKQIRAISDQVNLSAEGDSEINFKLKSSAEEVEVIIRNASGNEVRRETLRGLSSGDNNWTWDGKNDSGERMGEGAYQVEVVAKNGDDTVNSLLFVEGVASKVRFTAEGVYLSVNDIEIPIGDVEEVGTDIF